MEKLGFDLVLDCPTCYKTHIDNVMDRLRMNNVCDAYVCANISFKQILHTLVYYYKHCDVEIIVKREREDLGRMQEELGQLECFYHEQKDGVKKVERGSIVRNWSVTVEPDAKAERLTLKGCPYPTHVAESDLVIEGLPDRFCVAEKKAWRFRMMVVGRNFENTIY